MQGGKFLIHRKSSGSAGGLSEFDGSGNRGGRGKSRWSWAVSRQGCSVVRRHRIGMSGNFGHPKYDGKNAETNEESEIGVQRGIIARRAMRPWAAPPPSSLRLCRRSLTFKLLVFSLSKLTLAATGPRDCFRSSILAAIKRKTQRRLPSSKKLMNGLTSAATGWRQ